MKIVLAYQKKAGLDDLVSVEKEIELPNKFLYLVGLKYISTDDSIYEVSHTEFNLSENKLYFWVNEL